MMIAAAARGKVTQCMSLTARRSLAVSASRRQELTPKPPASTSQPVQANPPTTPIANLNLPTPNNGGNNNGKNDQKKKKKFSLFGFLFNTALIGSVVYGSTLYVATKNDKVMDFVIDQQLPYSDDIIEFFEKGSLEEIKEYLLSLYNDVKLPSKEEIDDFTSKIESKGEHLLKETKEKLSKSTSISSKDESSHKTPVEQLQKPVEVEHNHVSPEKLPTIKLADGLADVADESVKATIQSFNSLISLIDASSIGPHKDSIIKDINKNVQILSAKLAALNTSMEKELEKKLKLSQNEILSSYTQKELEMTQTLLDQFNSERAKVEQKYRSRVDQEVQAAKEALSQAAVNATSMVRVEQTKRFNELVKSKIDQERDGRLSNLDALNQRLEQLEAFASGLEKQVAAANSKSVVQQALQKLKSLLYNTEKDTPAKFLDPYVANLDKVSSQSKDEVLDLALGELRPLLNQQSNQSILTVPQLLASWEQITPELRSASLLPPNAGLLGHFASIIFSKFLLPVQGNKADGKDIESVIARVNQSLTRGQLDVAVEEVANLKGWSRRLADDWVIDARKRLEAEFLVSLIEAETKIM